MAEKLDNPVISNDDIFFVDVYSSIITFRSNDINIDDNSFDKEDPEASFHVTFMAWSNRFKQHKTCKKEINKE